MSVDIIDDELIVTISPIQTDIPSFQSVTTILSSSSSTPINASTYELSPSILVPIFATRATTDIEKPQFQPITDTLSPSSSTLKTSSTFPLYPVLKYLLIYHVFMYLGSHHQI